MNRNVMVGADDSAKFSGDVVRASGTSSDKVLLYLPWSGTCGCAEELRPFGCRNNVEFEGKTMTLSSRKTTLGFITTNPAPSALALCNV
mmetsp:Transcript_36944/g.60584  ORF Transcript_36944/g.60584 Transcript_36944/m.60584 type:complete len:89 (-) Transcript_36944:6-272(-)